MAASVLDRLPGGLGVLALGVAVRRQAAAEWNASLLGRLAIAGPRPLGLGADPSDLRPADLDNGRRILDGAFTFRGETLATGPRGNPWARPSPSRRFAAALHRFGWLGDLTGLGPDGAAEGLRLTLEWRRVFGRWSSFAWSSQVLERRVFNLACAARAICIPASEAETLQVAAEIARQARRLLGLSEGPLRAAERAAAAATAGVALGGPAGERLLHRALRRLAQTLPDTVMPDGGHASRSPQAALELFFDLSTLDEALVQRGLAAPDEMLRALDWLASTVRFFTLADGRLAAFQGGDALSAAYVSAARAEDGAEDRMTPVARNGYQRLEAGGLQVIADAAAPADGPWSEAACGQPLAIGILAGGRRLVVGSGWSPDAQATAQLRRVEAASTVTVDDQLCGAPLDGFVAHALGPRLCGGAPVDALRHEADGAIWLEMAHDGWGRRFGLRHERRLYLEAGELRGEDRLSPLKADVKGGRRFAPFAIRFHLHADVRAMIAQDNKSVLLKADGQETGWWLRSDALGIVLEPSTYVEDGRVRRSQQVVLRGQARLDDGARVRWKLSAATPTRVDAGAAPD